MNGIGPVINMETWAQSAGVVQNGVGEIELSWQEFDRGIRALKPDYYVWRGQEGDDPLKSTFDRNSLTVPAVSRDQLLEAHLVRFKQEMNRTHPGVVPGKEKQDEIWALGRHYGLDTPLLDWTRSPFVAAYFAFERQTDHQPNDRYRYVYALDIRTLQRLVRPLQGTKVRFVDFIEVVKPNPRLVAQQGVFTKALDGEGIEENVKRFQAKRLDQVLLLKLKVETEDRDRCLRDLHLMNIDYKGLLLDLRDVVVSCNEILRSRSGCSPSQ